MRFHHYIPRSPLSHFVEMIWYAEGGSQPHAKERLLPTGTTELVINLLEDETRIYDRHDFNIGNRLRGSAICGTHSEFFVIDTAEQMLVMGVHFKPGGIFPFVNLPASELHNLHVSLEDLWGSRAEDMRNQLLEVGTLGQRFRILERCLLMQAKRNLEWHPAVGFALGHFARAPHLNRVSPIIDKIGLSHRRFIELFSNQVGLTPKAFCRIRRFQHVLHLVHGKSEVDWSDVSLSCGYFDQAHFIHDFRAFAGINPTTYLASKTPHLNHVPMLD